MNLTNIVVATDLSEHCGIAAQWAQSFKEHVGASHLVVEHVIELSLKSWVSSAFEVLEDPTARAEAEEKIAAWFEQHTGKRPDQVLLRAGRSLAQLTETIEELDGESLLVVSMSSKNTLARLVVGSTANALASQPPCPLAIIHPEHTAVRAGVPVVTGTDLSANGQLAVAFAARLAKAANEPLEVVHAYGAPQSPLVNLEHPVAEETLKKSATQKIKAQPELAGANVTVSVLAKEPSAAIVERAEALGSDLIVLGHSGESQFVQSVLGSVAQKVMNRMPCSLIVVPGVPHDDVYDEEE